MRNKTRYCQSHRAFFVLKMVGRETAGQEQNTPNTLEYEIFSFHLNNGFRLPRNENDCISLEITPFHRVPRQKIPHDS